MGINHPDITWFISAVDDVRDIVRDIQRSVISELKDEFPQYVTGSERSLPRAMMSVSSKTDRQFIVIIEEWDAFFREAKNGEELQKEYVQLLCGLFKGGIATEETIAAAYMTGILPIKKYDKDAATAIRQIHDNRYAGDLKKCFEPYGRRTTG